jgi:hypothetical protein
MVLQEQKMDKTISLLPLLESEKEGFSLEIPISDPAGDEFHGDLSPFEIVDNGQRFSMIVKARLKASTAGQCRPLFLLVQRDHHLVSSNGLRSFTNADVDRIWLDTIQSCTADKTVFCGLEPSWFKPLFLCRKTRIFFHPPCPDCGRLLELCTEDRLLKKAALFDYHTSLKRYLFCPHCHTSDGKLFFYQYARSAEDRVFVKDRFDLIRDFARLRGRSSTETFPCPTCPDHARCYITGEKALSRISIFSFYPFYMLIFDAAVVKGVDFIPLLSGACAHDIPALSDTVCGAVLEKSLSSHGGKGFFFENEPRFFLEVLYLKLSFLEKFIRILKQKIQNNIRSIVNLSAHSIWLTPRNQGSMLPFFWEFDLNIIDLVSNSHEDSSDIFSGGDRNIEFIASLWFYTFLMNQTQGFNEICTGLRQVSANDSLEACFSDYSQLVHEYPFLAMENIFWHPAPVTISEEWQQLWLETMQTGAGFLHPHTQDLKTEVDFLLDAVDGLKQRVKARLFATQTRDLPLPIPEPDPKKQENASDIEARMKAVRRLLVKIKNEWPAQETREPVSDVQEEDVLETIVLSSNDKRVPKSQPIPTQDLEDLDETVVLTEDLDKTEILTMDDMAGSKKAWAKKDRSLGEEDDLEKTVVISPKK